MLVTKSVPGGHFVPLGGHVRGPLARMGTFRAALIPVDNPQIFCQWWFLSLTTLQSVKLLIRRCFTTPSEGAKIIKREAPFKNKCSMANMVGISIYIPSIEA